MNETMNVMLSFLVPIMTAAIGALTMWMFKLDERLFSLSSSVATREEITRRLDKMELELLGLERTLNELAASIGRRRDDGNVKVKVD